MENNELKIRDYLKKLTDIDIANSIYLFGVDFENDPIDSIMDSIIALYDNVIGLKNIIESDFGKNNEEKILLPQTRETQSIIIGDYSKKESVLTKILNNETIQERFVQRIVERKNQENKNSKR